MLNRIVLYMTGISLTALAVTSQISRPDCLLGNFSNVGERINVEAVYRVVTALNLSSIILFTGSETDDSNDILRMITQYYEVRIVILSNLEDNKIDGEIFERQGVDRRLHLVVCPIDCVEEVIRKVRSWASAKFLFYSRWIIVSNSSLPVALAEKFINFAYLHPKPFPALRDGTSCPPLQLPTPKSIHETYDTQLCAEWWMPAVILGVLVSILGRITPKSVKEGVASSTLDVQHSEVQRLVGSCQYNGSDEATYMPSAITPDSGCSVELMTLELSGNDSNFRLVQGIDICKDERYSSTSFERRLFPNLATGLQGRTILTGVAEWEPYVRKISKNGVQSYTGLGIVIMEEMAHYLNFKIKYIDLNDNDYKWSKLFDMLKNKELDILACPLMVIGNRTLSMDFTFPIGLNSIRAYYKIPDAVDLRWRLLMDLLSWPALVLTVISLLGTAFVLGAFHSIHSSNKCTCTGDGCMVLRGLQLNVGWFLFGNLMKQGQSVCITDALSTRLVVATWCVFCLVLTVTFTAYLVPALGVVKQPVLFRSVDDLLDQDEYKWGFFGDEGFSKSSLTYASSKSQEALYRQAMYFNNTDSEVTSPVLEVHQRKILNEKYVFFVTAHGMHGFMSRHCNVAYFGNLVQIPISFATPKHSPFTPLFSHWIVNFHENGFMDMWKREWYPASNCSFKTTKSDSLTLQNLQSVFVVLVCGITFSIVVLCFELTHYWSFRKRKR